VFERINGEKHHSQGNYFWLFCGTRRPQSVQTDRAVPRAREVDDGRGQSFVTAMQSTSTSKGPVHSGTQKKMRAGGFFGK
jgi:hypothetical protein